MSRRAANKPGVLLAGFEPFGGEAVNPAMELLAHFDGRRIERHRIRTVLLPVTFAGALTALAHALEAEPPVLALGIGQAGGRARLSLERVALNLIDARIPDNAGAQPVDVPVIGGAPDAYFSDLPLKSMLAAMLDADIPAELSFSAGSYVCNAMFFALRHLAATRWPGLRAGFIHVPYLPAQAIAHPGTPSMALATMREGVEVSIRTALSVQHDAKIAGGTVC